MKKIFSANLPIPADVVLNLLASLIDTKNESREIEVFVKKYKDKNYECLLQNGNDDFYSISSTRSGIYDNCIIYYHGVSSAEFLRKISDIMNFAPNELKKKNTNPYNGCVYSIPSQLEELHKNDSMINIRNVKTNNVKIKNHTFNPLKREQIKFNKFLLKDYQKRRKLGIEVAQKNNNENQRGIK
ncbi:MAG: hypothetical protein LBL75_01140 [Rickettsiales bacterium]|jgi:hypothetical protein|nr:hypothetical protein [Rickettsiales bacterium]